MCGICGIYRFDGAPVNQEQLRAMTARMLHRGPDDDGFYCSGPAGLGMRRLSIIDLTGGHQPIANEDETIWVVSNGEIYNHVELRAELEEKGHQFRTVSDTEILVHLYEEYGTEAVHHLNGMFAFALYDLRKRACWIVRDRIGVKPLYYAEAQRSLFYASDLDALAAALPAAELDTTSFLRYLALGYVPGPDTIYQGVRKLPPGCWLWAEPGGVRVEQYWSISSFQSWKGTEAEACDRLHELLSDAVRLQLRSDVPVGVFLSGGVDSSALVALSAGKTDTPLATFTANFSGKASADVEFARQVAARFGARHTEVTLTATEAIAALDDLMPFLDEPIADSALIPSYLISRTAQSEGIKVLLTGAGSDELFGGYERHYPPRPGNPRWMAEHVPARWRSSVSHLVSLIDGDRGMQIMDPKVAFGVNISGVSLNACAHILRRRTDFDQMLECLREAFSDLSLNGNGPGYTYTRMLTDLRQYLVGDILALTDKATMACSVEGRVPLLDHRLVEFAFALPKSTNLLGGRDKGLLRRALRQTLPDALLDRKKEGFNAPMQEWVIEKLGAQIEDELLTRPIEPFKEMLDANELRTIVKDKRNPRTGETVFSLYLFSRWYRIHIEKK
jgi:asparagine synthase (glutamine-hydrolysing)